MDRHEINEPTIQNSTTPEARNVRRNTLGKKLFATGVGIALAGSLAACGSETNEAPVPTVKPSTEAPVVPGEAPAETEAPTPVETEPTTSLELEPIPADASPEEIAEASTEMWNMWVFSGATEDTVHETNNAWFAYEGEYESFLQNTANKNAEPFVETYFASDWENNPSLVRYYDVTVGANKNYLEVALNRINNDKPLIDVSTEVSNVFEVPAPEGQRIIQYNISGEFTNSEVEYKGGLIKDIFDISDGTARLIGTETVIE